MSRVAASEAQLLTVARALVGVAPVEAQDLLRTAHRAPVLLQSTASRLLRETLSHGVVRELMRRGGARRGVFVDGEAVRRGRLWERRPAPRLALGPPTMQLLQWLVATPLVAAQVLPLEVDAPLEAGDEVVYFLALDLVVGTDCESALARQEAVRRSVLCRLAHAEALGRVMPLAPRPLPDMGPTSALAVALEALQPELARAHLAAERRKAEVVEPAVLLSAGQAQRQELKALFAAARAHGQPQLLTFLAEAGAALVGAGVSPERYGVRLDPRSSLAERQRARRAAGALVEAVLGLRELWAGFRATRFIDDGYAVAQAMLQAWAGLDERVFGTLEAALRELESLSPGGETGAHA